MAETRYQLALEGELPAHRSAAYSLLDVLSFLGVSHSLRDRLAPLFVFQPGEGLARAIWCPACGRVSWNAGDVQHAYCGFCQRFLGGSQDAA